MHHITFHRTHARENEKEFSFSYLIPTNLGSIPHVYWNRNVNRMCYRILSIKQILKASFWKAVHIGGLRIPNTNLASKSDSLLITPFQLMITCYVLIILRSTIEYWSWNWNKNAANECMKIIPHRWKLYSSDLHDASRSWKTVLFFPESINRGRYNVM